MQRLLDEPLQSVLMNGNLGLITMQAQSNVENLLEAIKTKIAKFGLVLDDIKVLIADGASVNGKISRISGLPIQKCINHCVQLAIVDTFYNRIEFEEPIDDDDDSDNSSEIDEISETEESNDETITPIDEEVVECDTVEIVESDCEEDIQPGLPTTEPIATELNNKLLPLVSKVSGMVRQFRYPNARRYLKKYTKLKLVLDCKTRWTSLEKMIQRFLEVKDAINKACIDMKIPFSFTDEQLVLLNEILVVLKSATHTIMILSSDKANLNTADLAISNSILALSKGSILAKKFASHLKNRFLERRTELSDVLAFFFSKQISQDNNIFYTPPSREAIKMWYGHFRPEINAEETNVPQNTSDDSAPQSLNDVNSTMNFNLAKVNKPSSTTFETDLTNFIAHGNISPFTKFIEDLMAIKPTSTDVERSFSLSGYILAPRRRRISDDLLDAIFVINRFYLN